MKPTEYSAEALSIDPTNRPMASNPLTSRKADAWQLVREGEATKKARPVEMSKDNLTFGP